VKNEQRRESGQALVAAVFGLVVLLGAAGLAVDLGYLRYQKRLQQSAADSAALAGAAELRSGNNAFITTAATNDTKLNGYTNGFTGPDGIYHVLVTVNPAFPFGAQTGVQVQVQVTQPTFFMRIFGVNSTTVTASAVAIATSARNCAYALDTIGNAITNDKNLTAPGCGIVDNSSLDNDGAITASSVAVHGTAFGAPTIPGAIMGIVEAADPLFALNAPATGGGCKNGTINGKVGPGGATPNFQLFAGHYCTGITISDRANVTFGPGTYAITGTGINFKGVGTVSGAGVTFYISGGPVLINSVPGSAEHLTLRAPTIGALTGILFYQNAGNGLAATIDGQAASTLQGALYFPGAALNLSNINAAAYTITVAKTLAFGGNVTLGSDYSSLTGGSPIKNAVLVE
jgi:Flp pilus assembly protein TadG